MNFIVHSITIYGAMAVNVYEVTFYWKCMCTTGLLLVEWNVMGPWKHIRSDYCKRISDSMLLRHSAVLLVGS